jgi:hypothetical protein
MRDLALNVATWLFARFVSKRDREPLLGDLAEEYALRTRAVSSSAALGWYLRQVFASIPPLVGLRLTRAVWLATLGVALVAYVAVGVTQAIIYWAIPSSVAPVYSPLGLIAVFPMVALIGYVAEGFRRRAALILGAMMLLAMTALTLWGSEDAPLWYRVAYFLVGPAAALIGSGLRTLRPVRGTSR